MDPSLPPTEAVLHLECFEGIEREQIASALDVSRDEWIAQTQTDYWSGIHYAERCRLAGGLNAGACATSTRSLTGASKAGVS